MMGDELQVCADHVFCRRGGFVGRAVLRVVDGRIASVTPLAPGASAPAGARDFGDAFVCAGFHDAHQHVFHSALFPSDLGMEYGGTSEADCVAHLQAFAAAHPGDGWLVGHGWRDTTWTPAVEPTRASLDAAFPDRPVALYGGDAHSMWVNTAGLKALGITDETRSPAGGVIRRDEQSHATGVLLEAASMVYMARALASLPKDQVKRAYLAYFDKLLAQGVTSVCDMGLSAVAGADCVNEDYYEEMLAEGTLPLRVHLFPQLIGAFDRIEALQARLTGDMLRAPGMKQFFDGVSSAHTAWLTEPYANPYFPGDRGRPTVDPAVMRSYVLEAAKRGIAVRIHTIGDAAIHEAIDIFREAQETYGAPRQGANALEHLENLLPGDVEALARTGLVASVQPQHIVIDITQPERDLGPDRVKIMWPFASYDRAGVPMAFGTDAPCVTPSACQVLSCAVSRQDPATGLPAEGWLPEERVDMACALDAFTRGGAQVVGREDELGTLEPGKLADFAVFDRDLLSTPASDLADVRCLATYVGGRLAYEA